MPEYLPADKYCVINDNDSVLRKIVLKLPSPPPNHLIDGYGLPPTENYFRKLKVPEKLILIEERAKKITDEYNDSQATRSKNGFHDQQEFWKIIESEKESLTEEIKWLKKFHWHMRYGYWFMCYDPWKRKSKPVWITPWHFFYLNCYWIEKAQTYPEYRDRDRRAEVAAWYSFTTTETFKNTNPETGEAIGTEMVDVGRRTMFGTLEPKRRRGGATNRSLAHGLWILMMKKAANCTIVADKGDHAEEIFKTMLSPAWEKLPMYIRPSWNGDYKPDKAIVLRPPKSERRVAHLNGKFGYTATSSQGGNDFDRLDYILQDEQGKKTERANVRERSDINRLTMAQMLIIHGYSDNPSTVEEIEEGGGDYHEMFDLSNFYFRDSTGQTLSGFMSIFIPAPDGADGFIDKWGYSVIKSPTEDQIKYAPHNNTYVSINMGAEQMLKEKLQIFLNDGSPAKLNQYRQLLRKNPLDSSDCWRGTTGDMGLNVLILDKALNDARYLSSEIISTYRMEWKGGQRDTEVVLIDDPNGRFLISDKFVGRCNKWKYGISNHYDETLKRRVTARMPFNPLITTGGFDSFQFRTTSQIKSISYGENTNLSDGAGAVLLNYDSAIDAGKEEQYWLTPRFICTYRARPSLDIYMEDMIMMAFYFGCLMNGERQTSAIIDYFIKRGYAGYLNYMKDIDGKVNGSPCIWGGPETKQDMLNFTKDHIDHHGHKEIHTPLLEEWKSIPSPDKMPQYDLFAAAGWALYAYNKGYQQTLERISHRKVIDISKSILRPHDITT